MAQTAAGIVKMRKTIRERYGLTKDGKSALHVYAGALGGKVTGEKGFASKKVGADGLDGRARAAKYGKIGGLKSRRPKVVK